MTPVHPKSLKHLSRNALPNVSVTYNQAYQPFANKRNLNIGEGEKKYKLLNEEKLDKLVKKAWHKKNLTFSLLVCSRLRDIPLNWESANFSRAFYFRVFPTIWEPGTA